MGLDILLWIGLALAAGFIGYFGRYPAKILLDKILKKKSLPDDTGLPRDLPTTPEERVARSQLKVEKKKAKQEVKKAKKAAKE